jgi:hypothetical protein
MAQAEKKQRTVPKRRLNIGRGHGFAFMTVSPDLFLDEARAEVGDALIRLLRPGNKSFLANRNPESIVRQACFVML